MNFMPAELSGGKREAADRRGRRSASAAERRGDGQVIAGLRPENFEDAEVVGDLKRGARGRLRGRDRPGRVARLRPLRLLPHRVRRGPVRPARRPRRGQPRRDRRRRTCARARSRSSPASTPTSKVKRGETAELWADTAKLHLFDPESGESLRTTVGVRPISRQSSEQATSRATLRQRRRPQLVELPASPVEVLPGAEGEGVADRGAGALGGAAAQAPLPASGPRRPRRERRGSRPSARRRPAPSASSRRSLSSIPSVRR